MNILYNEDCIGGIGDKVGEGTVDLVIADPPYFKVIGESWDYEWRTEKDYINWSEKWIGKCVESMRLGGSIYLFGYFRMLCRLYPLLEKWGLTLRQQIIIDKGMRAVSGRATKKYKMFPCVTESILFLYRDSKPFVREYLKERQRETGISSKEINERLGVKSNGGGMWSIYTGKNVCEQLPTREIWEKLEDILEFSLDYGKIAQTYNAEMGISDVWRDIDFYGEKRIHPTQKPYKLIERLVRVSSNEGDIVLDPFVGSGVTGEVCNNNNRQFIGFEKNVEYYRKAKERIGMI